MAKGKSSTRPTNVGAKPPVASNRILNRHPRLGPPRSKGKGDVDVTFGVNIPLPAGNPISERSQSIATGKPKAVTGSTPTFTNKYRRNTD